jgi:hypothetical protein
MDRILDTYDHPKLNQEDISHLNRSIIQNEIEPAVKSLLMNGSRKCGIYTQRNFIQP